MREILFRGFYPDESRKTTITINETKVKGLWVFGYYVFRRARSGVFGQTVTDSDFDKHIIVTNRGESYEVVPETVGQYTGLTDKNGKNIFDWDIVKCYDKNVDESFFAIIMFGNPNGFYNYGWQLKPIGETYFNIDILCWVDMEDTGAYIEIIGNIFENPELLEENK